MSFVKYDNTVKDFYKFMLCLFGPVFLFWVLVIGGFLIGEALR